MSKSYATEVPMGVFIGNLLFTTVAIIATLVLLPNAEKLGLEGWIGSLQVAAVISWLVSLTLAIVGRGNVVGFMTTPVMVLFILSVIYYTNLSDEIGALVAVGLLGVSAILLFSASIRGCTEQGESWHRAVLLTVPVLGSVVVLVYEIVNSLKTRAEEVSQEE